MPASRKPEPVDSEHPSAMKSAETIGFYDGRALQPLADYIRRWTRKYSHSVRDDEREKDLLAVADRVQALAGGCADVDLRGELSDIAARLRALTFHVPSELHHAVLLRRSLGNGHLPR